MDQGAEHNTADVQGSCLFYEGGQQVNVKESSFGSLIASNETSILERQYVKTEQGRSFFDGGLMESRGLFNSQESKRLKMASEKQQDLLLGPRFQYGVNEGSSSNVRSSIEGSSANVRSSLVVESSREDSFFKRAHAANSLLSASCSTNNVLTALPLLSNSCKNDPPLLQDLPWFANHALEEEEVGGGLAGFPLVRPTAAAFSNVSLNTINPSSTTTSAFSSATAHAPSSGLISLLGENDAEHSILQAHIVAHPLFEQLLAAHLACLRMGTPPERWLDTHSLDSRLALSRQELDAKYLLLARNAPPPHDKDNLDHFMLSFTLLLQTFREQLREHVQMHAAEASSACAEMKDSFLRLTGETRLNDTACTSTMSEDEDMMDEEGVDHPHDAHVDASMCSPFNMASEIDKSLMESVRKELKLELKQNYRSKLWEVREEIMRKRRAGKLPGTTTSHLKDWWDAHSKWPYPTEEEKMKLVQETGLELKQINNWFINQRKRNWTINPANERAEMDEYSYYGALHPSC